MNKVTLISLQKRGGGALDILGLSDGLCENKFRHEVVISSYNEFSDRFNDNEYRKVVRVKTFSGGFAGLLWSIMCLRPVSFVSGVAKAKPQTVHVLNFHPWIRFLYLVRPFYKFRIIYSPQDNPFDPKEKNPPLMNFLEKFFVKNADGVIAYSKSVGDGLNGYISKQAAVMPLGIYPRVYGEFEKKFNSTGALDMLFFGRVEAYKGVDVLIDSYRILKDKNEKVRLTIAGRGDLPVELARKAKELGIVLKNYWLSNEELGGLIRSADVIVAPYKEATQSAVVMTAISYLIPVIVTDVGSLPDYVTDGYNGYVVGPNDASAIARSVEKFVTNRDLVLTMSQNQKIMRDRFSWRAVSEKAIEAYRSMQE